MKCGLTDIPNFRLINGVGDYGEGTACVMSAAVACYRLSKGQSIGEATDEMDCCCPVIRAFLIRLNDSNLWRDDQHRTDVLMPFVPRLAGTRNDSLTQQRMFLLVDWSIRTIAADAMERAGLTSHSESLKRLSPIVDESSSRAAAYDAARAADAAKQSILDSCIEMVDRLISISE